MKESVLVKNRKSRFFYVLLAISGLGFFGVHNAYAGRYKQAKMQLFMLPLTLASSAFLGFLNPMIGGTVAIIGLTILFFWPLRDISAVKTDGDGDPFA